MVGEELAQCRALCLPAPARRNQGFKRGLQAAQVSDPAADLVQVTLGDRLDVAAGIATLFEQDEECPELRDRKTEVAASTDDAHLHDPGRIVGPATGRGAVRRTQNTTAQVDGDGFTRNAALP